MTSPTHSSRGLRRRIRCVVLVVAAVATLSLVSQGKAAWAKCPEDAHFAVVGVAPASIDELCVFVGATGRCVDTAGGPFAVNVVIPVVPVGRLFFNDRCARDMASVTLVSRIGDDVDLQTCRLRRRDIDYAERPAQIALPARCAAPTPSTDGSR